MGELVLRGWRVAGGTVRLLGVPASGAGAGALAWLVCAPAASGLAAMTALVGPLTGGTVDVQVGGPAEVAAGLVARRVWRPADGDPPASLGQAGLSMVPGAPGVGGGPRLAADAAAGGGPSPGPPVWADAVPPPGVSAAAFFDLVASRRRVVRAALAASGPEEELQVEWGAWRVELPLRPDAGWRVLLGPRTWAAWDGGPRPSAESATGTTLRLPR